MKGKVLVALGGNALLQATEKGTYQEQLKHAYHTAECVLEILKEGYFVALTHGNGPQVGNILLKNEMTAAALPVMPLDVCGAESQGFIGYMLQRMAYNVFKSGKKEVAPVTILTQVLVSKEDPAFKNPSKPIGMFYNKEQAERLRLEKGWAIMEQVGKGFRRAVPSPEPVEIIEGAAIKNLFDKGMLVIACGGGGIPVIRNNDGTLEGVEAVIDKDKTARVLAKTIGADILMILTDVEKAAINFHKPDQKDLGKTTVQQMRKYLEEGQFGKGSMGPKVEAACRFIEAGGKQAIITSLDKSKEALKGNTGTVITI